MKDFFAEEIEGKTATLTLPEKPPKKDFYSEEIGNDFYSKEIQLSTKSKEKKPKNWITEGIKGTIADITALPFEALNLRHLPGGAVYPGTEPTLLKNIAGYPITIPNVPGVTIRDTQKTVWDRLQGKYIKDPNAPAGKLKLETSTGDITTSPLDIGLILGIPAYQGVRGVQSKIAFNKALQNKLGREMGKTYIEAELAKRAVREGAIDITQVKRESTISKPLAIKAPTTPNVPKTIVPGVPAQVKPPIMPEAGITTPAIPIQTTLGVTKLPDKPIEPILPTGEGKVELSGAVMQVKRDLQEIGFDETIFNQAVEKGVDAEGLIKLIQSQVGENKDVGVFTIGFGENVRALVKEKRTLLSTPTGQKGKELITLSDEDKGVLNQIKQDISGAQPGKRYVTRDEITGEVVKTGYEPSDYSYLAYWPEGWGQEKLPAIENALKGKITELQKENVEILIKNYKEAKNAEARIEQELAAENISQSEIDEAKRAGEKEALGEFKSTESNITPSGQIREELHPPLQKDLFQEKGELFEAKIKAKAIKKDYFAEEVETPSAFAGTIPEEPPTVTAPSAGIIKRSQIITNLGNKLNVPIRKGGFGGAEVATRGALGIYKPKPDIIRWKSGGVGTISHEIGHFLDDNFKDLHELIKASRQEIGPLDYDPMKQRANEGFSEFLRYWTTKPEVALNKAPQFHAKFENWLNNNPDVRVILDSARKDYQAWLKMPSVDKVKSQISFEPEAQAQGIKHTIDSLYNKVVDELAPIQRYVDLAKKQGIKVLDEENPYVLARLLKGNTGKANHFLNHKTFNTKLEITGKGLREILEPVKNNLEDFSTYLVARRVPELKERGKETGITKQDALNTILELDKKYPQFKEVTEELYAYQDRLLQYAFENGLISPMGLMKMKALNQNYVPFYRVFEELQRKGYMGDTLANLSSPIKRMTHKGSERDIIDPIESIMKNTYAIINTADRNAVARGMIILSKQNKELGRLFEKIATPLSKVATVDLGKEVNKILAEEGKELPEDDINMIIDIFRPSFFTPKDNTITVMQGGKKEFYYVDSEIYKAMMGLEKEEMSMLIKILSYPAKWLRAGATSLSPEFLARNPLRDQFSAYVYSKTGYVPGVDLTRGVFNLLGKSDLYWEWVRGGGEHSTIVSVDREYMQKNLKELFNKNWKDAINPLKWMQAISEFGEQGTRLGEFVRGRKKEMGIKESAFAARNVTLDFAKMGSKIKTANKITAFMAANINGLFRPAQAFREKPASTWFKILTGITLPSILLYLMNRDDERYKELPRWQKDLFWIIRVPANTPSGEILLRIPKPFELGVIFGTVPERILEYIDTKDPAAFDKLRDTVLEGAYLNPKQWIPTALVPILENMTNWSFFRDKKLESMGMERILPEERYTAFTSETAKKLGRVLGYSPVKIENLVSGYTGAGGQLTLDLLDFLVTGGKRKLPTTPETMPVIRGFVVKEPVGSFSESVNKFYDNYEKITQVYNTMQEANKRGDREKFNELRKRYPKVNPLTNGMIVRESKKLAEGRKEINKILDSEDITPEIKLQKIRSISVRMTEIAKQVNNRLKE